MGKVWYNVSITTHTEGTISRAFEALVKKHPGLSAEASYSYDAREGDTRGQLWGITRIYCTTEDGETEIGSSSSTYWDCQIYPKKIGDHYENPVLRHQKL